MEENTEPSRPWEALSEHILTEDAVAATALLESLNGDERGLAVSRLPREMRPKLIELLDAETAADLFEDLPEAEAVRILSQLEAGEAAPIVEQLGESEAADLLRELEEPDSSALISEISDDSIAEHLRARTALAKDSAGGLMSESYVWFIDTATVGDVLSELSENADQYSDMDVQYVYLVNSEGHLGGVLRLRDLVLTPRAHPVRSIMIADPVSVGISEDLEKLTEVFEEKNYIGLPVVDESNILRGIISRRAVREAVAEGQTEDFLRAKGIVGGEELRSMPLFSRSRRRLAWLAPNIILNLIAASVIANYQDTLEAVIALAVFLPIVSDMSGCSGNQAVAVSMRELTLGLIRPNELWRVMWKEGTLGIVNGTILGGLLGTIAGFWQQNVWLGLVIGFALAANTLLSVLLGGLVPLFLKRLKVDPALASGPILTTCTDVCGFFLVLNLAAMVLAKLA